MLNQKSIANGRMAYRIMEVLYENDEAMNAREVSMHVGRPVRSVSSIMRALRSWGFVKVVGHAPNYAFVYELTEIGRLAVEYCNDNGMRLIVGVGAIYPYDGGHNYRQAIRNVKREVRTFGEFVDILQNGDVDYPLYWKIVRNKTMEMEE